MNGNARRTVVPNAQVMHAAREILRQGGEAPQACAADGAGVFNGLPYYSTGRLTATRSGAGPYTYTCPKGQALRLFGFAIGDDMAPAGMATIRAQDVDTNLAVASETNAGEDLTVYGIGLQIIGAGFRSDPAFVQAALPECSATIEMQGRKGRWDLGPLDIIPGACGSFGAATSAAIAASVGSFTNGYPVRDNFLVIPGGVDWTDKGTDSQLVVIVNNPRDIVFTTANAGPATITMDFRVQLFCTQLSDRSNNQ